MKPLHSVTPYFESLALSATANTRAWLKMEALQPPGSFKIRGIGLACQEYASRGARRFISSSGGNAGIAVAYAGRHLSVPVVVVVPETTTERAKALIRQQGAEIIVHGASFREANAHALSMLDDDDAFLHPFDDPLVWRGHASLVDEMASSGPRPDAVVLSVGGGGLMSGVMEGMLRNGWDDVPVVAAETVGADSLAQSIREGKRIELDAVSSIATSLGATQVCEQAFEYTRSHTVHSVVVTDEAAVTACRRFIDDHRIVVEPACGAALAVVYDHAEELEDFETVAVVVCGGVTATLEQLEAWSE